MTIMMTNNKKKSNEVTRHVVRITLVDNDRKGIIYKTINCYIDQV